MRPPIYDIKGGGSLLCILAVLCGVYELAGLLEIW